MLSQLLLRQGGAINGSKNYSQNILYDFYILSYLLSVAVGSGSFAMAYSRRIKDGQGQWLSHGIPGYRQRDTAYSDSWIVG
jgi:hypothetical protein